MFTETRTHLWYLMGAYSSIDTCTHSYMLLCTRWVRIFYTENKRVNPPPSPILMINPHHVSNTYTCSQLPIHPSIYPPIPYHLIITASPSPHRSHPPLAADMVMFDTYIPGMTYMLYASTGFYFSMIQQTNQGRPQANKSCVCFLSCLSYVSILSY